MNLLEGNKKIHLESQFTWEKSITACTVSITPVSAPGCVCVCACASFKDHQRSQGRLKLCLTLLPRRPSLECERSLVYVRKTKGSTEERKKGTKAQLKWVEVVRYWFTIMADPDDACRVHLCYQRWAILIVLDYDQEYFFLKAIKLKRNKRLLSGA